MLFSKFSNYFLFVSWHEVTAKIGTFKNRKLSAKALVSPLYGGNVLCLVGIGLVFDKLRVVLIIAFERQGEDFCVPARKTKRALVGC